MNDRPKTTGDLRALREYNDTVDTTAELAEAAEDTFTSGGQRVEGAE